MCNVTMQCKGCFGSGYRKGPTDHTRAAWLTSAQQRAGYSEFTSPILYHTHHAYAHVHKHTKRPSHRQENLLAHAEKELHITPQMPLSHSHTHTLTSPQDCPQQVLYLYMDIFCEQTTTLGLESDWKHQGLYAADITQRVRFKKTRQLAA